MNPNQGKKFHLFGVGENIINVYFEKTFKAGYCKYVTVSLQLDML